MLSKADLDELASLHASATPGPWHIRYLDDDHAMCAVGIATSPDTGEHEDMATFYGVGPALIAATLIQAPPYVTPSDGKWDENATLITTVRNALPELIELARRGIAERS